MTDFFMTFCSNHVYANHWVRIVAPDENTARRAAEEHFPRAWSGLYPRDGFLGNRGHHDLFRCGELAAFRVDADLNHRALERRLPAAQAL